MSLCAAETPESSTLVVSHLDHGEDYDGDVGGGDDDNNNVVLMMILLTIIILIISHDN